MVVESRNTMFNVGQFEETPGKGVFDAPAVRKSRDHLICDDFYS